LKVPALGESYPSSIRGQLGSLLAGLAQSGDLIGSPEIEARGLLPESVEEVMRVQAASVEGHLVAGWKVAIGPGGLPVAAPLLNLVKADSSRHATCNCPNLTAVEVEIAFCLKSDLAPDRVYGREDVLAHIGSVHLGIELIAPRLREGDKAPFLLFLADRLGNGGYVVGPELDPAVLDMLASAASRPSMKIQINGAEKQAVCPAHVNGDPLAPLVAYANAQNDRLDGLRGGQFVTTGSLCGVLPVRGDCRLQIDWLDTLSINCRDIQRPNPAASGSQRASPGCSQTRNMPKISSRT
jgi:2-keto-4-pentenoate hydratase